MLTHATCSAPSDMYKRREPQVTEPVNHKLLTMMHDVLIRRFLLNDEQDYTSGSDHDATDPSFSSLLNGFFSSSEDTPPENYDHSSDPVMESSLSSTGASPPPADRVQDMVRLPQGDCFGRALVKEVTRAVERLRAVRRERDRGVFLRAVMGALREEGYDAGVCKARWGKAKGVSPGSYDYIDVVRSPPHGGESRYIVDVGFASEFEIARPSEEYEAALAELPGVYVGTAMELKQVLSIMADAATRSLKSTGLHVPPWRKRNYMSTKWLGPYKRTTNLVPSDGASLEPVAAVRAAKCEATCRTVGFEPRQQAVLQMASAWR